MLNGKFLLLKLMFMIALPQIHDTLLRTADKNHTDADCETVRNIIPFCTKPKSEGVEKDEGAKKYG